MTNVQIGCSKIIYRYADGKARCVCGHCRRRIDKNAESCRYCGAHFIVSSVIDAKL